MKTSERLREIKERCCNFNVNFPDDIIDPEHFEALDEAIAHFKEDEIVLCHWEKIRNESEEKDVK